MPSQDEIADKFWKSLKSDMTLMLGLTGVDEGSTQPMTAQFADGTERGVFWFFTAKDVHLVQSMGQSHAAAAQYVAKGHDLFASIQGTLSVEEDPTMVERLWSRFVAAWFPGGKQDPKLRLLRFEATHAHVWLNETSLLAGVKILLGSDPKKDYKDKVADVRM